MGTKIRLLKCLPGGRFELIPFDDNSPPPYAILSHTWDEGQEVTYQDLMHGTGGSKSGFKKIRFCGQQAEHDDLQYFWVDTCCIDKSNEAEVQRAINSMFRWYRKATQCYVYLSDVSTKKRKADDKFFEVTWESAFRVSRWFTRGWTLQELLAPLSVHFFSYEGKQLGDRSSLEQQICEITGVPASALQGSHLSQFSDKERFSWMQPRKTKIEEDKAYSLLGIFGVEMDLRYGEGSASAFRRLEEEINKLNRCLQDLRSTSTDPSDDKKRIEETKGGLLEDSYCWILKNPDFQQWHKNQHSHLLWIKGDPGKGKTMLLCGIINELKKSMARTALLSYFFCQATDLRINNATAVLRGLIYILVSQQPSLASHIQKKYNQAGITLFDDTNAWFAISDIFTNILQDPSLNTTYLIIDALDECITDLPQLLNFVVQISTGSSHIKWIISSRNWPDIIDWLQRAGHKVTLCLELNPESISMAVSAFIKHKVDQLKKQKNYDIKTEIAVQNHLSSNADNTFLWVALVCQHLEKIKRWQTIAKLNKFPPGLDSLYQQMLEQIHKSDDADLCKQILALIAVTYRPITLKELTSLIKSLEDLSDDLESIREIINLCGSFLTVREDTIYFVHQSVKDFLFEVALNKIFPSGKGEVHDEIFLRSLQIMSRTLKRDIYSLGVLEYSVKEVKQPDPDPLVVSRYSCIYWINHLYEAVTNLNTDYSTGLQHEDTIKDFIKSKYLYWLEALSLCRSMSEGVVSMAKLETLLQQRDTSELLELVRDARRFIMSHKQAIENSPLQAYMSALMFSPTCSPIRNFFKHEEPKWIAIKPPMRNEWGACLQTLEDHSSVYSVAFSHDSTQLASGSQDGTVKIWDASSGTCLQTLKDHGGLVSSVAFSHDSTQLASGWGDPTVRIWDPSSGACLQTLKGHSSWVHLVTFSHDSMLLASASDDSTIKIWDVSSSDCLQTLKGHSNSVNSVAFSHDSMRLASASDDRTVKIWDVSSGNCLQTLKGHSGWVNSVAFSHDSMRLASGSHDHIVKIWDPSSGACLQTLKGHSNSVRSVAFSHDSMWLASGSWDHIVKIWDTSSGACLQTLKGHSDSVRSVAFSHDSTQLASTSDDHTVKIWDTSSGACLQPLEDHSDPVSSMAFSHDSIRLASGSEDGTVKIWDTSSGACLQTLKGHSDSVRSVAFSHDSTQLASTSDDHTVKIWDTSSGACLQTLKGHSSLVNSVAFSHDSMWLASGSWDGTVKIWDASSGACLQTLEGHSGPVRTVAISHWDESSGAFLQTITGHIGPVSSAAFSHDSTQLASGLGDSTVEIWDESSGDCLQTLEAYIGPVSSVAFSHDSTRLASGLGDGIVKTWDASSGACLQTLEGHIGLVSSVAFSHNSAQLASGSMDGIVKIWDASSGACLQTLKVDIELHNISFNDTGSYLYTDIGTITISASAPSNTISNMKEPQYQGVRLSSDRAWITYNSEVIWLPSEYRPSCSAISAEMVGIGTGSGQVWIYRCKK